MNSKDLQVHAIARELAVRKGTTVTDAVRQALGAELERSGAAATQQQLKATASATTWPWPSLRRCCSRARISATPT